jgi:hypothetical protein
MTVRRYMTGFWPSIVQEQLEKNGQNDRGTVMVTNIKERSTVLKVFLIGYQ